MELILLGYHRSGTSALAQYLADCGLFIGDELLDATPTNPFGHFEDKEIVNIHQKILNDHGEMWLLNSAFTPIIKKNYIHEAADIVKRRNAKHIVWGFKDPRTCLFPNLWKQVCPDPKWIIPLRHYSECIDSILRRAHKDLKKSNGGANSNLQKEIIYSYDWIGRSWLQYMYKVLNIVENDRSNTFIFEMRSEIANRNISQSINDKFNSNLENKKLSETFDSSLFSSEKKEIILDHALEKAIQEVWNELIKHAGEEKW